MELQHKISFTPIGKIINEFDESTDPYLIKSRSSRIIIDKVYSEALININDCEYLDVVFYFNQLESENISLSGKTCSGAERGAFASRSPNRPNLIGVTTVKLLEINENELIVQGLDALNGSPVFDIKSCDTSLLESNKVHHSIIKSEPRIEIQNHIANNRTDLLLIGAAQMHGHYCPGLAMGVMAAVYAMRHLGEMKNLTATVETKNCFADGVQWVTGCTFGNKALIYKELGETALTLLHNDGKGIRICSKDTSRDTIAKMVAKNRAFDTLNIPFDNLFTVEETETKVSEYI
jgi:formylmethanofuran dehydrogenase subunit E